MLPSALSLSYNTFAFVIDSGPESKRVICILTEFIILTFDKQEKLETFGIQTTVKTEIYKNSAKYSKCNDRLLADASSTFLLNVDTAVPRVFIIARIRCHTVILQTKRKKTLHLSFKMNEQYIYLSKGVVQFKSSPNKNCLSSFNVVNNTCQHGTL